MRRSVPAVTVAGGLTEDAILEPWGSTLLLVEDDPAEATRIKELLDQLPAGHFHVSHVETAGGAVDALSSQDFSAVMLDLSLPDAQGLEPLEMLLGTAPTVPVVVVGGWSDQTLALRAVGAGAQDFVLKSELTPRALARGLRYAIERRRAESRLHYLERYDQLTGLANRAMFREKLDQALTRAELSSEQVALLYINLDRLDEVSTVYGGDVAERILRDVAKRLLRCVREAETVARVGEGRFCVILEDVRRPSDAQAIGERIHAALTGAALDVPAELSAQIGIVLADPLQGVEALLERADHITCRQHVVAESSVRVAAEAPVKPELTASEENFAAGEFTLVYQPRVDLELGRLVAVEAFVRWEHPERGLLRPREFIPVLESSGLMLGMSDWVVGEAAKQAVAWKQEGLPLGRVTVNLAVCQFTRPDIVDRLAGIVAEAGADPTWMEFECAERMLLDNPARSRMILKSMQAAGFRTAIDHFGTGFGHLSELARLPLDVLKVDRSVVEDLDDLPARRALVAAAVALGRELALEVVAEGVERERQVKVLRDMGATSVQGFWLAEPKAPQAFAEWYRWRTAER